MEVKDVEAGLNNLNRDDKNLTIRAFFKPDTINVEKRTVNVVFATEYPVQRFDWRRERYFNEILVVSNESINPERISNGAPLLDGHNAYGSVRDQLGVIDSYWVDGDKAMATVRFSKKKYAQDVFEDVIDGIVQNISVGYDVDEWEIIERENELPDYRAIKWTPKEISFVKVNADPDSKVREYNNNQENNNQKINQLNSNTMRKQLELLLNSRGIEFSADATEAELLAIVERSLAAPAVDKTIDVSGEIRTALNNERERVRSITEQAEILGLERSVSDDLTKEGVTAEVAAVRMIAKAAEKQPGVNNTAAVGATRGEGFERVINAALDLRNDPTVSIPEGLDEKEVRSLASGTLMSIAKEHLNFKGIDIRGLRDSEVAQTALNVRHGMMTTSDLPLLLTNAATRSLMRGYSVAERTFQAWTRREDAKDFREETAVGLTSAGSFDVVLEGGEYQHSTLGEYSSKFKVAKYGTIVPFSWEAVVNDDLSAFSRIPQMFGNTAAKKQTSLVYSILASNPILADGNALFSAAHNNVAGTPSALSYASLALGYTAMRMQTDPSGFPLTLAPKYLIVGPLNEINAYNLIKGTFYPTAPQGANDFYKNLVVVVDASITDYAWYLSADPNSVGTIRYGFLRGEPEVWTDFRTSFEIDGMETKFRMIFGSAVEDFRGLYKNAGAAS